MRRPTRAQLRHRWLVLGGALVLVVAGALWVARPWAGGGSDEAGTERPGPAGRVSTTAAPPAPTTTTTPTGRFTVAPGIGPVVGQGPLHTYRVEVEEGTAIDVPAFAADVEAILSDPRGWTAADGISLQRVEGEADIVVMVATPPTVDLLCFPLETDRGQSCAPDHRAIVNVARWREGAAPSKLDLEGYRAYLISHEVGHTLGHGHVPCPGVGAPTPVMVQQTLGIGLCAPNPWPAPAAARTG